MHLDVPDIELDLVSIEGSGRVTGIMVVEWDVETRVDDVEVLGLPLGTSDRNTSKKSIVRVELTFSMYSVCSEAEVARERDSE